MAGKRNSTGMYYGFEGPSPDASAGLTQIPRPTGHSRTGSMGTPAPTSNDDSQKTYRDRVNQIVQAFFWKAAMTIIQSRMPVQYVISAKSREPKTNKWFNIELDEMESFREELRLWRNGDSFDPRPPPLILETYLDVSDLTPNQALVILDSKGKRWNVTERLENAANRAGFGLGLRRGGQQDTQKQHIVLERWKIELSPPYDIPHHLDLPVVYKKSIIMFRSLYSYIGLMPTWKFRRRLSKPNLHANALKVACRVHNTEISSTGPVWDGLKMSLYDGEEPLEDFDFGKVESPAGYLNISVMFRKNCDFRVVESEALLSSQFINLDEHHYRPSFHQRTSSQPSAYAAARAVDQGSLPSGVNPAYGSLSSFHQAERYGSSPMSALRTAAETAERAYSASPAERPGTAGLRSVQGSRSSLRSGEGAAPPVSRRGSISFMQPFKSPSLSASPAASDPIPQSSVSRVAAAASNRHRLSVGTVSPSSFKSASSTLPPPDNPTAGPVSASPKPEPMVRITSSFGHRRPRTSGGTAPKPDDDGNSSGQASYSSAAAPGSGLYDMPGISSCEDDKQIEDFIGLLNKGPTLKSFGAASSETSSRKVGSALSKYQKKRDSHTMLADSMSSSLLLQPSPSTSTRNPANAPLPSSSPSKPMSPHTLHTPTVPSPLGEGSIATHAQQQETQHLHHRPRTEAPSQLEQRDLIPHGKKSPPSTTPTSPRDIPLTPRFTIPRRANSMSQQPRETIEDDTGGYHGLLPVFSRPRGPASLGSAGVDVPSLSRLTADLQLASESLLPGHGSSVPANNDDEPEDASPAFGPPLPLSMESPDGAFPRHISRFSRGLPFSGSPLRGRVSSRGRGDTGSTSSLEKDGSGSTGSGPIRPVIGGRTPSWSKAGQEDEDLLFTMSDMMTARRSLEQDRSGGDSSASSSRRRSRGGAAGTTGSIDG